MDEDKALTESEPQSEPEQTKPETDWKAEARKWEQRAKENKKQLDELSTTATNAKAEAEQLEKANTELDAANKKIAELEMKATRNEIAAKYGIPADVISGDTAEAMDAHAQKIKALIPSYTSLRDSGEPSGAPLVTREGILAIKSDKERVAAIKEHIELFQ